MERRRRKGGIPCCALTGAIQWDTRDACLSLLPSVSEPRSGSTSQALSIIPETIPLGTNATSLAPSSALPGGADPYPGTRKEHREPQRRTTSAWSSFIFRAMPPPQGRRKGARCCLPHQGLQRSSSASPAPWLGERPALAKLWLLVLFKGLMARHPRGVAASP